MRSLKKVFIPANLYLLAALAVAAGLLYFADKFLLQVQGTTQTTIKNPVANLSHIQGDVKTKRANGLEWLGGSEKMALASRDKVRTGANSNASIELKNGTEIKMRSRALMVIRENNVDFQEGSADISQAGAGMEIQLGDKRIRIGKGEVDVFD